VAVADVNAPSVEGSAEAQAVASVGSRLKLSLLAVLRDRARFHIPAPEYRRTTVSSINRPRIRYKTQLPPMGLNWDVWPVELPGSRFIALRPV
jgi:hypothetical protein